MAWSCWLDGERVEGLPSPCKRSGRYWRHYRGAELRRLKAGGEVPLERLASWSHEEPAEELAELSRAGI